MNYTDFLRYQFESIKRSELPPIAKHGQTKPKQPQRAAA